VHIISQKAYGPSSAVTCINSTALHWCYRPHRANGLTESFGNREVPKKVYDKRNEREETAEVEEGDERKMKIKVLSRP
jgi:hypothetical protein